jgi:hypothetical protein
MQFLINNFEIIVFILFIITLALIFSVLSINKYFAMYFSNKKFLINSSFEIDAANGHKDFSITIYNKNINDIRISGFGYVYKGQNIDFYQSYLQDKGLPESQKIVISSRDYLTAKIDIDLLKAIISDINKGNVRVDEMKTFVTDSLGLTTTSKANQIKDKLAIELKKDQMDLKIKIMEQKKKLKDEEKLYKKKNRIERSIRNKERFGKILLKLRRLFSKRKNKQ